MKQLEMPLMAQVVFVRGVDVEAEQPDRMGAFAGPDGGREVADGPGFAMGDVDDGEVGLGDGAGEGGVAWLAEDADGQAALRNWPRRSIWASGSLSSSASWMLRTKLGLAKRSTAGWPSEAELIGTKARLLLQASGVVSSVFSSASSNWRCCAVGALASALAWRRWKRWPAGRFLRSKMALRCRKSPGSDGAAGGGDVSSAEGEATFWVLPNSFFKPNNAISLQ